MLCAVSFKWAYSALGLRVDIEALNWWDCSFFLSGAFKTLDKDNSGTIKVNVQEVITSDFSLTLINASQTHLIVNCHCVIFRVLVSFQWLQLTMYSWAQKDIPTWSHFVEMFYIYFFSTFQQLPILFIHLTVCKCYFQSNARSQGSYRIVDCAMLLVRQKWCRYPSTEAQRFTDDVHTAEEKAVSQRDWLYAGVRSLGLLLDICFWAALKSKWKCEEVSPNDRPQKMWNSWAESNTFQLAKNNSRKICESQHQL